MRVNILTDIDDDGDDDEEGFEGALVGDLY